MSLREVDTDQSPRHRCVHQELLQGLVVERRLNLVVELGQIRPLFTSAPVTELLNTHELHRFVNN